MRGERLNEERTQSVSQKESLQRSVFLQDQRFRVELLAVSPVFFRTVRVMDGPSEGLHCQAGLPSFGGSQGCQRKLRPGHKKSLPLHRSSMTSHTPAFPNVCKLRFSLLGRIK